MGARRGKWGTWWSRLRRLVLIPIFALLGATLVVVGTAASPSSAATTPESCFTYNNLFNTSTGTIGGYNIADTTNCTTTVNIPSTISGVPVLAITGAAFLDYGIVSVTIPNTVTTIGNRAFEQSGSISNATLTSVTLGSSVTSIGTQAFNNNKLTSLTIPNSLTSIGDKAFKNQGPASYSAGAGATLTSLTFQSGGSAPLTIGSEAFRNTALATVDIPDRVTTISDQAFMDDPSMVTLRVGTGVTSIGSKAFTQNYAASSGATTGSLTNAVFRGNKPFFGNLSTGVPANPNPFNATGTTNWYYWNTATGWTSSSATGHTMSGVDPPTIVSFSPTSGSVAGGTDITITGTNFVDGATATVGGTGCASTTFVSSTSLICRTAASTAGSGLAVSVTNPIPNVATKTGFTYFDSQSAAIGTTTVTGANELTVNWANPDNSVVGYTVEASTDAGSSWSAVSSGTCSSLSSSGPATSCTATELTAKTDYQFRVTSSYSGGPAAASGASTAVTTATAPDAPTIGTTTKTGNLELTVNWTPNSANNSPVTSQTVEFVSNGSNTITSGTCANVSAGATSCTVTGLTNATGYTFRVKATNDAGTSDYSADSASVTTQTAPGAPTITSVADSCGMVSAFFTAPAANGSPAITTYQYSTDGGTTWVNRASTSTASPLSITALSNNGTTALTNGTTYPIQIRAYNGAPGAPSTTVNGMARNSSITAPTQTYTVPAGVTAVKIVATGGGGGGGSSVSAARQGGSGGQGGMVTTTQPVTPGHTLNIKTGGGGCGASTSASTTAGGSGSANGGTGGPGGLGGKQGGGAGGATTIMDTDGSSVQIIVGGGGGGGGSGSSGAGTPGGAGGGSSSTTVANGSAGISGGGSGGGTGTDSGSAAAGTAGSSTATPNMGGGGGGGAGYAGGQGGQAGAGGSPGGRGGGGGSSKVTTTSGSESTSYTFGTASGSNGVGGNSATALAGTAGVGGYVTITPLPTATSATATSVASTSATLNGAVSANDSAITSVVCRYSTTNTDSAIDAATPVTAANPSVPTSASGAAAWCSATGLTASTTYYFKLYATSSAGTTGSSITSFTTAAATPANTALPTITGTATPGQTLTAQDGTWTGEPAPSYSYQWQQCDAANCSDAVNINSATAVTFDLTNAQIGKYVRVQVTGTNSAGTTTAYSTPTAAIAGIAPANTVAPTITGTTTTGQTLTAHDGTWTGTPTISYSYQWQQCTSSDCSTGVTDIGSATAATFDLTNSQIGTHVRVQVSGTNSVGTTTAYSNPTAVIAGIAPANTAVPTITGTTTTGQTLTAHDGTWIGDPAPSYSYQWQQCTSSDCSTGVSDISSATASTFALTNSQIGTYVRVQVTGTNSAGTTTAYSNPTAVIAGIAPAVTHGVEVAGTAVSGQTLTASADTWSGEPTPTVGYQWQQCSVANCGDAVDIPSATSTTFVLTDSQVGKYVRMKATGHNSTSPDAVSFSLASGPIAANTIAPSNTGLPVVSGTTVSGSVLSTTDGSWTGTSPITYAYQWQTCSTVDCSGGTVTNVGTNSASLTLSPSHVGTYVRVQVTAHNGAADVTATSTPTAVITGLALTPTLGAPVSTADGYTFTITNYDTAFTWAGTATNGGAVGIVNNNDGTATATVTNLTPSSSATATITTTRANYPTGTSTVTGTAKAAPPAGDTAVTVSTPVTQFVIGQQVPVTVDITSGATKTGTRSSSAARSALADADGTATISVNGIPACTATVTNGRGTCAVTIRSNGTQKFTATFTGTLNGQAVILATTTPTKATAATVSLLAATGRVRGCRINATIAGRALTTNRTITIQTRRGGSWTTLTTTRTNNKKNWKTTITLPGTSLKIRAKDKTTTTASLTITLTNKHKPNQRGC